MHAQYSYFILQLYHLKEITPKSTAGRVACMIMIILAIILVPEWSNELVEKMNESSIYERAHYETTKNAEHIVISGNLRSTHLLEFFEELFHPDHEVRHLHAVILQEGHPTREFSKLFRHKTFGFFITYLAGNPLVEADLYRASVHNAKAVFIMTNNDSPDPDDDDAKVILQQFSILRFIRANTEHRNTNFCLQLIRPENKKHLVQDYDDSTNIIVCLNEIKMGILASALNNPGANTLLVNLITSFSIDDADEEEDDVEDIDRNVNFGQGSDWLSEYRQGCDWEVYTTELSGNFVGR